jgi:hypothetical protein
MCNGSGSCLSGPAVYGFTGFSTPVDNPPTLNVGKAGRTFPVKWQLPYCAGGFNGDLSTVTDIEYRKILCDTFAPQDAQLDADTAGSSGLHYDPGAHQFIFNWQTKSSFSGCYELRISFANGSEKWALFKFTK